MIAGFAFERAQIMARFVGRLDACELREHPALRTQRAVQLDFIDMRVLWLCHALLPLPVIGGSAIGLSATGA
jgi:hypothetical protein